jgi:hypothetical protein
MVKELKVEDWKVESWKFSPSPPLPLQPFIDKGLESQRLTNHQKTLNC